MVSRILLIRPVPYTELQEEVTCFEVSKALAVPQADGKERLLETLLIVPS